MAGEVEEGAGEAAGGVKALLMRKIGPLPAGVWLVALAGGWLYLHRKGKSGGSAGVATDPAGNTGTIDPATGYVAGSPQDTSALGEQSSTGMSGSTSGSGGSTVAGQFGTNDAWARAAVNYLVGIGVDPTAANSAIQAFLSSQTLTTDQQGDVNLAIQSLGAPPTAPNPGNSPPPVYQPNPGTVYAANPVTGLTVSSRTANSAAITWNRAANAQGYTVAWSAGGQPEYSTTVSGNQGSANITGLQSDTFYNVRVQATPAKPGDPSAQSTFQTTAGGSSSGGNPGSSPKTITVTAADAAAGPNKALGLIAARAGHPGSSTSLYDANRGQINTVAAGMGAEASQHVERTSYGQKHHLSGEFYPVKAGMTLQYPAGW